MMFPPHAFTRPLIWLTASSFGLAVWLLIFVTVNQQTKNRILGDGYEIEINALMRRVDYKTGEVKQKPFEVQVFLDKKLIGTTPFVLTGLQLEKLGLHRFDRIVTSGKRHWTTWDLSDKGIAVRDPGNYADVKYLVFKSRLNHHRPESRAMFYKTVNNGHYFEMLYQLPDF